MPEMTEITKVRLVIRRFLAETKEAIREPEKAQEWLCSFRDTLLFQDLCEEPMPYAMELIDEARGFSATQQKNAQKKVVRRILGEQGNSNPTDEQIEAKWAEMYGNGATPPPTPKKALQPFQKPPQRPGTDGYGKFGNVFITGEEYSELGLLMGNQNDLNSLIDNLGASLEDGSTTSSNHYATLVKWVQYRKDKAKEAKEKPHYESYTEHNKRVMERCHREIAELKEQGFFDD